MSISEDPNAPGYMLAGEHASIHHLTVIPEDGVVGPSTDKTYVKCKTCPAQFEHDPEKDFALQCYECYRDPTTRRICQVCEEPRIVPDPPPAKDWKKICSKCYAESDSKKCLGCKEPKLKKVEKWRLLCKDCWQQRHKYLRICSKCDIYPIKPGSPSWCNVCFHCYIKEKELKYEKCPSCQSTKLTKSKWAPACRQCMLKQGLIVQANKQDQSLS